MIPVQLTIEGLYSYQQRQTIDFTRLTEAGLFGIFGAVGSGKSSILEAVSFALYGETERLNSKDRRAYNMMNLKSNRSYIAFDFINFENRTFRAAREFRRNSKRFDDVKSPTVVFYEKKEGEWIPLEHTHAEKIVGLSYDNFKRTIIIPQGQFREFLELGASDRTKMMKEIFQLQRFDLYDKASALAAINRSELDILEGKLSGLQEISEEIILEKTAALQKEEEQFSFKEKEFGLKEKEFGRLAQLREDFASLKKAEQQYADFRNKKSDFELRQSILIRYEKTERIFRNLMERQRKNLTEQKSNTLDLDASETKEQHISRQLEAAQTAFEAIAKDYSENLPLIRKRAEEMSKLTDAHELNRKITDERLRTKKGKKAVEDAEASEAAIRKEADALQEKLSNAKTRKTDTSTLLEIDAWFVRSRTLRNDIKICSDEIFDIKKQTDLLSARQKDLPEDWKTYFENEKAALKKCQEASEDKRQQLLVTQKLEEYAQHLHNGEACPLCGAREHPDPASGKHAAAEIYETEKEISTLKEKMDVVNRKISELEKNEIRKLEKLRQTEILVSKKKDLEKGLEDHLKKFVWKDFSPENEAEFLAVKKKSLETEAEISSLEQQWAASNRKIEIQQSRTKKYQEELKKIEDEILKLSAQQQQLISGILLISEPEKWLEQSREKLTGEKERLEKTIADTEKNYLETQKKISELKPELASVSAKTTYLKTQKLKLQSEASQIADELNSALRHEGFAALEEVEKILKNTMDTEKERLEIQHFLSGFAVAESRVLELTKILEGKEFSEEEFIRQQTALAGLKKELDMAIGFLATLRADLKRIRQLFDDKKELLSEQTRLRNRAEHLRTMTNLFKGTGFVQYVSSIYLRQLCDHANVRFHKMTRNQLSLQLSENNDFEIIDYLNEGRSRSVKTLSGGQAFQVSLSLALALAESVQSHAQADRNFFFIDEGFGTQDPESAGVVFETLSHLQKENRIVGIISHVEELKERIPVSLNIVKDEEKGSLIQFLQ